MKNKLKFLALSLCFAMTLSLYACGESTDDSTSEPAQETAEATADETGEVPEEDADYCIYSADCSVSGPYEELGDLTEQIVKSLRLNLPEEYDNAGAMEVEATAQESGPVDITGATIDAPEGWNVESSSEKSVEYSNADIMYSSVDIDYMTNTQSAEEWINSYDGNFGGGNEIDQVTIGDITYYHFSPVDGQEVLTTDGTEEGTVLHIYSMSASLDEITPLLETITLK